VCYKKKEPTAIVMMMGVVVVVVSSSSLLGFLGRQNFFPSKFHIFTRGREMMMMCNVIM
jgi:hypothetical protein